MMQRMILLSRSKNHLGLVTALMATTPPHKVQEMGLKSVTKNLLLPTKSLRRRKVCKVRKIQSVQNAVFGSKISFRTTKVHKMRELGLERR